VNNVNDTMASEPLSPSVDENRRLKIRFDSTLMDECLEHGNDVLCERNHPFFGPLATTQNVRGLLQLKVFHVHPDGLRDTRSATNEEEEQCIIAPALWEASIGNGEDRVEFVLAKVVH